MAMILKGNGTINHSVLTVDALSTINNPQENDICIVTDENRGGTFIYRSAEAGVNNGGTVFNGWCRQYDGAVNVKWFGAVGDGISVDQIAITLAVNGATELGADLEWGTGVFISTSNIPGFNNVYHTGLGIISRDGEQFYITPRDNQNNTICVNPDGDDDNDGIFEDSPVATIQRAIDLLQTIWLGAVKDGIWTVRLAGGTYSKATLDGITGNNSSIIFEGPDVSFGTPLAIIDGEGVSNTIGLYLRNGVNARVRNIKFINFPGSNGQGLTGDHGCLLSAENIHANGCGWAGINLSGRGELRTIGGLIENCGRGIRIYGNAIFSVGAYSISNRQVIRNCATGVEAQNASQGHIDYTDIISCTTGAYFVNQSRAHMVDCLISDCTTGVSARANSTWIESGDTVFTGNSLDRACAGFSMPYEDSSLMTYSPENKRYWYNKGGSGASIMSGTQYVFEFEDGKASLDLLSRNASSFGISFATTEGRGSLYYRNSSSQFRIITSGVTASNIGSTGTLPGVDGTQSLGSGGTRWSVVYAGTGTINTSDAREKTFSSIPEVEKQVAIELKGLMKRFKFNDAIETKGIDNARIHYGTSAQEVISVFEKYGLNAMQYAMVCYDEWEEQEEVKDEEGTITQEYRPAGNRYGIRYEELLCFIISAM